MNRFEHKIPAILIFANGLLCLLFSKQIYLLLPTILGLMMIVRGISMFNSNEISPIKLNIFLLRKSVFEKLK